MRKNETTKDEGHFPQGKRIFEDRDANCEHGFWVEDLYKDGYTCACFNKNGK